MKSVRVVTESFVDIFRCQMRKLIENVFDRVTVGQVIKDQGDGDACALDDRLAVHDTLSTNDPRKSYKMKMYESQLCNG